MRGKILVSRSQKPLSSGPEKSDRRPKRKEVAWSSKSPLVVCWAFLRPTLPVAMESWLKIFSGVNCVITICTWPWRRSICTLIRIRGCVIISNHCLLLYLPLHQPCWSRWLDRRLGSMQMVSWSWKAHDLSTPPTPVDSLPFKHSTPHSCGFAAIQK